jgi:hypothetical protein
MTVTPLRRSPLVLVWLAALLAVAAAAHGQAPRPARPAPKKSPTVAAPAVVVQVVDVDAELAFLRTATVVAKRPIGKGITGALRVTLNDGVRTHDAAFQRVAEQTMPQDLQRGRRRAGELFFVDHYRYNIAAWRLAGLLGLAHMMPPTIERSIDGRNGALSWWMDDVLMDEQEREAKGAQPPSGAVDFARQRQSMWVFAELVRDTDRNKGNVVYTKDWRVIMLDFTRAFRLQKALKELATLNGCSRDLLARLRALSEPAVKGAVEHHLTGAEITAVMARRDLLVAHFERLIAERGEAAVIY